MALQDQLAEELAEQAMSLSKRLKDPTIIEKVAKTLGDSSQTLQEAFLTVVRLRTAAERGQQTIDALVQGEKLDILDNPNL